MLLYPSSSGFQAGSLLSLLGTLGSSLGAQGSGLGYQLSSPFPLSRLGCMQLCQELLLRLYQLCFACSTSTGVPCYHLPVLV